MLTRGNEDGRGEANIVVSESGKEGGNVVWRSKEEGGELEGETRKRVAWREVRKCLKYLGKNWRGEDKEKRKEEDFQG